MKSLGVLEHWYEALHSPIGMEFEVDNPDRFIQLLYAARRESGDEQLNALSIVRSPINPSRVWIMKRKPDEQAQE